METPTVIDIEKLIKGKTNAERYQQADLIEKAAKALKENLRPALLQAYPHGGQEGDVKVSVVYPMLQSFESLRHHGSLEFVYLTDVLCVTPDWKNVDKVTDDI